ncbi:MAG: CoA transferase, partial [Alphaproteobacteria bacterium]|nr:CoA transferase [Alphaproteobacteria bacterium]
AALFERGTSGKGQVVDAAMVDGAASLMTFVQGLYAAGWWRDEREANLVDGGAPFYRCYETRDGKWVALGAIEPEFYDAFLKLTGLDAEALPKRMDRARWPELIERFRRLFLTKTREEWCALLEGTDACFAPVLSLEEAPAHPHMAARSALAASHGIRQSAPAPRFSRTPGALSRPPSAPGEDTREALTDWGLDEADIDALIASGAAARTTGAMTGPES